MTKKFVMKSYDTEIHFEFFFDVDENTRYMANGEPEGTPCIEITSCNIRDGSMSTIMFNGSYEDLLNKSCSSQTIRNKLTF